MSPECNACGLVSKELNAARGPHTTDRLLGWVLVVRSKINGLFVAGGTLLKCISSSSSSSSSSNKCIASSNKCLTSGNKKLLS